ncbi:acyl-CoA dehydrogenase family protein [Arthrobacter antibioticus]|uniref:acyl-CoA dehydrogenase family protein n=1 Tax=Arthrobacter sp. H35-MC1 TaxID=3046203 RepID=UPI0024B89D68|nr:acyl-CoA dehydrogenase family protein [Arthrobacter sp. H35-MC1]MDJ0317301.1 acyl-CoA dehydrogenase family protein [Arthrobacter sp. H35-MC1]
MIQRLKDKLGNRSNASAELEFANTVGWRVGEPGRGVRAILTMVGQTRFDCILGTAGGVRQSVAYPNRWPRPYGMPATAVSMRLSSACDDDAGDAERAFRRLGTALTKYWVCKRGPNPAYEAMEYLAGNGYIEDFPLAMRSREQPVMAIWEGTCNVIALDVLSWMCCERWPPNPNLWMRFSRSCG